MGRTAAVEVNGELGGHAAHLTLQAGEPAGQFGVLTVAFHLLGKFLDLGVQTTDLALGVFQFGPHVGRGVERRGTLGLGRSAAADQGGEHHGGQGRGGVVANLHDGL